MRSVRIATWTSGDPVSPDLCACSLMSAVLRSAVIDIVGSFLCEVRMRGLSRDRPRRPGRDVVQRGRMKRIAPENPARDRGPYTRKPAENQRNLRSSFGGEYDGAKA